MKTLFALLAILLFSENARAEIYKCNVDGKVIFSDVACKGGGGAMAITVDPPGKTVTNNMDKIRLDSDIRVKKKLITDDIERSNNAIYGLNKNRDEIMSKLRSRMGGGNSIRDTLNRSTAASEMVAVNFDFDNKIKLIQNDIDRMKTERDNLK